MSSEPCRTRWRKLCRRDRRASSRPRITGFRRVWREAYLEGTEKHDGEASLGGGWIGDDCVWRALRSMGEMGDEARIGDEESGEGTAGRWSHAPEKMGCGGDFDENDG